MPSSSRSSPSGGAFAALLVVLGAAFVLAGCSAGAGGATAGTAPTVAVPMISDAWVRPPMGADRPAAGYLAITNTGTVADALLGAASPVASSVELHETSTDSSGMTGMHPIARLEIPPGGTVSLEPGGYHLMLMGVGAELKVGAMVELRLEFEKAGTIVVRAEVRGG